MSNIMFYWYIFTLYGKKLLHVSNIVWQLLGNFVAYRVSYTLVLGHIKHFDFVILQEYLNCQQCLF